MFDFTINLGHVAIVISTLITGALFYSDKQANEAVVSAHVEELYNANLPTRMQAVETTTGDLRHWMDHETDLLTQIRDKLDQKADKKDPKN